MAKNSVLKIIVAVFAVFAAVFFGIKKYKKEKILSSLREIPELSEHSFTSKSWNSINVKIQLKPTPRKVGCIVSDWDGLYYSLVYRPKNKMIATFERLDKRGRSRNTFNITLKDIDNPMNFNFSLPTSNELGVWAFFVCNDSKNTRSCAHKPIKDSAKIIEEVYKGRINAHNIPEVSKDIKEDHVFVYDFGLLIDNLFFYPKEQKRDLTNLKKGLFNLTAFGPYSSSDLFVKNLESNNNKVLSYPFAKQENSNFLSISIPQIDRKKCSLFFNF